MFSRLALVTSCLGFFVNTSGCEDPAALLRAGTDVAIVVNAEQIDVTCDDGSVLSVPKNEMKLDAVGRLDAPSARVLTTRFESFCRAKKTEAARALAQEDAIRQEIARYQIPTRAASVEALRSTLCLELGLMLPSDEDARERALRSNQNRFGCAGKSGADIGRWTLSVLPERKQVSASVSIGRSTLKFVCNDDLIELHFSPGTRILKKDTQLASYEGKNKLKLDATPLSSQTYRIEFAGQRLRDWKDASKVTLRYRDVKKRLRKQSFNLQGLDAIAPIFFRFCSRDARPQ